MLLKLADVSGILFNDGHRHINALEAEIIQDNRLKPVLAFKFKDLGTYVTGVRVATYTPHVNFANIVQMAFGETNGPTALQFLRGCSL